MKNLLVLSAWIAVSFTVFAQKAASAVDLIGHPVEFGAQGELVPWAPFGQVLRLGWEAFERVPLQPDGLRTYFTYSRFSPEAEHLFEGIWWAHNPAGLNAMLVDGATAYYAYSGDARLLSQVRESVDYQLAHGTTPSDWAWASVPFASSFPGEHEYRGADDTNFCQDHQACGRGDGIGVIEPDKVGELGLGYLKIYGVTQDPKYLGAALACANALARHVRPGDLTHSPWPFRVDGQTGLKIREEYSANALGPIALFDELARKGVRDPSFANARKIAWNWLMRVPMSNMNWSGYFEDIPIHTDPSENPNQYIALETARYLLWHPEFDVQWKKHAKRLIDWSAARFAIDWTGRFGVESGIQFGAEVMSEQIDDMAKMGSHTARFASVMALYAARAGDPQYRDRAQRSLSWASYTCSAQGIVKVGTNDDEGYWFSDGYGDYLRHFQSAMAAQPEWAPSGENHILRSDSVIRQVTYASDRVTYDAADPDGQEIVNLRAIPPSITCDHQRLAVVVTHRAADTYTVAVNRKGCTHVVLKTSIRPETR